MRFSLTAGILARVAFSCLLVLCIFTPHARADQPMDIKKVLILFSYEGWSAPANRMIYNGVKTVFDQSLRQDIVLIGDNLDLTFVNGEAENRSLAEFFQKKYARENIHVVVPVGLAALGFVCGIAT